MSGANTDPQYFKVTADILQIQSQRIMWYTACQGCRKKINPSGEGWYCDSCGKYYEKCNYTYNFTIKLGDQSDAIYCQCLGEAVGDEIIGMTADKLRELAESDSNFAGWNAQMGGAPG